MPERFEYAERARELVRAYLRQVDEAERKQKPGDGVFGLRGGVKAPKTRRGFFDA